MHRTALLGKMLSKQGVGQRAQALRNKLIKNMAVVLIVITLSALFCVWSRVRIVQMGYEITILQREASELSKEMSHLELEMKRLKSPGHLQNMAVGVLKMHPPTSDEIIFVKESE